MSLDEKFIPVRTGFYEIVDSFFKKIAGLFGYPEILECQLCMIFQVKHMLDQNFLRIFHHIKLIGPQFNAQKHGLK
jgi:hypothetical protein